MEASRRMLVVDDEATIRTLCQRLLSPKGYEVRVAASGDDAIRCLNEFAADVVLTDISMPGSLDGPALLKTIKDLRPETDVIMMTGYPSLSTAIPTLKLGAYDYLIKPFDNAGLLSVIDRCFEKRLLSRELNQERLLREELQAAYTELQKVEKMKEAFLSRLSHELRTPFTSVFFMLDEIDAEPAMERIHDLLPRLRDQLTGLWTIVQDLLMFTELSRHATELRTEPVDLQALLLEVTTTLGAACEAKGLTVTVESEAALGPVPGDPALLRTVFKHLFLNAIHFNKKQGAIKIRTRRQSGEAFIEFEDSGIGIPADKMSNMFDNFYQVADYLTREVGGLGLGLAVVRHIVELHGGRVSVASQEGLGSTFTVALPAEQRSQRHA